MKILLKCKDYKKVLSTIRYFYQHPEFGSQKPTMFFREYASDLSNPEKRDVLVEGNEADLKKLLKEWFGVTDPDYSTVRELSSTIAYTVNLHEDDNGNDQILYNSTNSAFKTYQSFMEKLNDSMEEEAPKPKRGRGRPRLRPPVDPYAPKKKRGRPRKSKVVISPQITLNIPFAIKHLDSTEN